MHLERATDAGFLNAVCNHPDVRPFLYGSGAIDLTPVIQNQNNLAIQGEHGGMLMVQMVKGIWELHTQVLPDGRGPWALEMAQGCVDWLFSRTNAIEVFTRVPDGNVAAMALSRACGARLEEHVLQDLGAGQMKVSIYGGRIQDWIKVAPGMVQRGQLFHSKLRQKYADMGMSISTHTEDPWHDRHVGAAAGMIIGGQPIKGIMVFNRWAAMALAPPMRLVSLDPLVLDITDCRIEVIGDDFEVVPCPQA